MIEIKEGGMFQECTINHFSLVRRRGSNRLISRREAVISELELRKDPLMSVVSLPRLEATLVPINPDHLESPMLLPSHLHLSNMEN